MTNLLTSLSIKNYALIEDINIGLQPGFTIITGETGAGKSIMLGALGLLLGDRADFSSIRDTEKKCVIEGTFGISNYKLESVERVSGVINSLAAGVITTLTLAPAFTNKRTNAAVLKAAIPPVIPNKTFLPLSTDIFESRFYSSISSLVLR